MDAASQHDKDRAGALKNIASWLIRQGLEDTSPEEMLEGYCLQILSAGIPVQRVHLTHRAIHPEFGGLGFSWRKDQKVEREQYEHLPELPESWKSSPFFKLLGQESSELRERLAESDKPSQFPFLNELRAQGTTDYYAARLLFSKQSGSKDYDPKGAVEGFVISWTSNAAGGFTEADIEGLRELHPSLGLALKSMSNRQTGQDLLRVYLGKDVGKRVLSGEIQRGSYETIRAVILYFDLQGFTRLSETVSGASVIEMLNDYFGPVVTVIEAHGGNVLKFMGDGLIAIFRQDERQEANLSAIDAAADLRQAIAKVNLRRKSDNLPYTGFYVGLHSGDVLYGNIGGSSRLDFTVIGPAVNTAARIVKMCSALEENVIMSSEVALSAMSQRNDLVSLGPYKLRGVKTPQELFTLLSEDQSL